VAAGLLFCLLAQFAGHVLELVKGGLTPTSVNSVSTTFRSSFQTSLRMRRIHPVA
jgi:hypothetical protein